MKQTKKIQRDSSGFNLQDYGQKHVLITGASGYLGAKLASALEPYAAELTLISRTSSDLPFANSATCKEIVADINQPEFWGNALEGVDCLFHLACQEHRHGLNLQENSGLETNVNAVLSLLEACRKLNTPPRLVFASTVSILASDAKGLVSNNSELRPMNFFGVQKATAEKHIEEHSTKTHMETVSLRLCNVYGPGYNHELSLRPSLNRMIHEAVEDGEITIFANHDCTRDFLFVEDAIEGFLRVGCQNFSQRTNRMILGSGESTSFKNLANLIAERVEALTGSRPQIKLDKKRTLGKAEWRDARTNAADLQQVLSWSPKTRLSQGIDATINNFRHSLKHA